MKRLLTCVALSAALGLAPASALAGKDMMVHVGHNKIDPADISIGAGDTVTFHNLDQMPGGHTIVADDGSFESPPLGKDEKWTPEFSEPGTHGIHIKQHPTAKATIVVE